MANDYSIPWKPLDIGPGAAFIASVLNSNRENDRADEFARIQREQLINSERRQSAEDKRKEEDEKYNRAVQAFAQMPALQRMAMKSVGMANANPYGIKFEEQSAAPPSLRDSGINVMGGNEQYAQHAARVLSGQPPVSQDVATAPPPSDVEGPRQAVDTPWGRELLPPEYHLDEETRAHIQHDGFAPLGTTMDTSPGAPPVIEPFDLANNPRWTGTPQKAALDKSNAAIPEEVAPSIAAAQAFLGKPRAKSLFATYNGQRFEVPQTSDHTPFGAEYDSIYQGLLDADPTMTPANALKIVAAQYKADQGEKGRETRLTNTLDFRAKDREDKQEFIALQNKEYKNERLTNAERERLIELAGKFKVAAAAPGMKQEAANDRAMSLLERAGAGIRQTAQFAKLAASDKMNRTVMMNIANGTTPLQHRDAQISLARIFRQAQPTEGEMHILYNNLGGTMDKWNQFVANVSTGDLSPEQMRQLRISAVAVKKEHEEDLRRFQNVAKARLGPGGGFDLLPDQAQALYQSLGSELGLDNLPPLYQTEGGITVGSGKRPTVQPRGTKPGLLDQLMDAIK